LEDGDRVCPKNSIYLDGKEVLVLFLGVRIVVHIDFIIQLREIFQMDYPLQIIVVRIGVLVWLPIPYT
jgi:hypothetical protein